MAIQSINTQQLQDLIQQNPRLQLVDVRTQHEYEQLGHIPQARLIPLSELPYAFRALDPNDTVVVTCQHGIRSIDACYFLHAQGFGQLYNLTEGMSTWTGHVAYGPEIAPTST